MTKILSWILWHAFVIFRSQPAALGEEHFRRLESDFKMSNHVSEKHEGFSGSGMELNTTHCVTYEQYFFQVFP